VEGGVVGNLTPPKAMSRRKLRNDATSQPSAPMAMVAGATTQINARMAQMMAANKNSLIASPYQRRRVRGRSE